MVHAEIWRGESERGVGRRTEGLPSSLLSGIVSRAAVVASVAADTTVSGVFLLVDRASEASR